MLESRYRYLAADCTTDLHYYQEPYYFLIRNNIGPIVPVADVCSRVSA